jgi:SAM-dependent methyltransferase
MLAVARQRPGGDLVSWICSDAASLDLGEQFDLIVMTGHAFQTLLSDDEANAVLAAIARHLAPEGRFLFDSRNPARAEWRDWTKAASERTLDHPQFGRCRAWNDVAHDAETGIVTYETCYAPEDGPVLSSLARIRFINRDHLADLVAKAGLAVEQWLGDWSGAPFDAQSKEIIPFGKRA